MKTVQEIKLTDTEMFELYQLTLWGYLQRNDNKDLYSAHRKLQKAYYMNRKEHLIGCQAKTDSVLEQIKNQ